jgi:toxin YhaV
MVVDGWSLYTYHLFDEQLTRLIEKVRVAVKADSTGYKSLPATKLLATIDKHIRELIPANPNASEFRQGNTLGKDNKHWFRAKFHERYRLFFRFSTKDKVIVYAWVNDDSTLRKKGSKTDPYTIFQSMLESGRPPDSLEQLIAASCEMNRQRFGLTVPLAYRPL